VIRDLVYLRTLKNRSLEKKGLDADHCLIDILSDLDRLVRRLGGRGAVISPEGVNVFVDEVSGAEFIPWHYVRSYIIEPTHYGVDMHLIFDAERIRADKVTMEGDRFLYKTMLKALDGRMRQEKFWVSLHTRFSVAQKVRIHPPNSKKTFEGFGVALEGVSVQVIGRLDIQSIIIMRIRDPKTGREGRKVVVAVEGFTREKNPRPLFVRCEEDLDRWMKHKMRRTGDSGAGPAISARGDRISEEAAIESIERRNCSAVAAVGPLAEAASTKVLEVKQKSTLFSMALDYWYLTIALCFCELYSIYKLTLMIGKATTAFMCMAAGAIAAFVVGGFLHRISAPVRRLLHIPAESRRRIMKYAIATAIILSGCSPETAWLMSMRFGPVPARTEPVQPRPVVEVHVTDVEECGQGGEYLLEDIKAVQARRTKLSLEQDRLISELNRARRDDNEQARERFLLKYRALEVEKRKVDMAFPGLYHRK
jgi:hypothetical protein